MGKSGVPMSTFRRILLCVILSLSTALALGWVLVHESNYTLAARAPVAERAGIPFLPGNPSDLLSAPSITSAALFYAIVLGFGLPVLILIPLGLLKAHRKSRNLKLLILTVIFLVFLASLNSSRFAFHESWFALGVTLWTAVWMFPIRIPNKPHVPEKVHASSWAGALLLSTGLVLIPARPVPDILDYKTVRDVLEWPHPWGTALTSFYYRYTLMAAEPLKSPIRRTHPLACADPSVFTVAEWKALCRVLLSGGVLLAAQEDCRPRLRPDWIVERYGGGIRMVSRLSGRELITLNRDFAASSHKILEYLQECEGREGLTAWLRWCLSGGIPAGILFMFLGSGWWIGNRIFRKRGDRKSRWLGASLIALAVVGMGFAVYFRQPVLRDPPAPEQIAGASQGWSRIRALRSHASNPARTPLEPRLLCALLEDPDPRIRYWAAVAAKGSEGKSVLGVLVRNAQRDPAHGAASAIQALGRFHHPETPRALSRVLQERPEWYVRDRAYRVLEASGWRRSMSGNTAHENCGPWK